ncbi:unnamed protein product [Schistosoma mattheei]|uniref:Uncharacterized protein n=1 Tax=Schistosoma mattheei TaxID=31246 RepID=A0A183Q2B6_9TREM|nr:unnamed protein product [Schistosoma mattheei]
MPPSTDLFALLRRFLLSSRLIIPHHRIPPIHIYLKAAAHALHHETRLWSSRDNELIAATKRMAALMAQLSQIVR